MATVAATVLSVTSMARNIGIGLANLAAAAMAEWSIRHMMVINGAIIIFFALATRVREEHLADRRQGEKDLQQMEAETCYKK